MCKDKKIVEIVYLRSDYIYDLGNIVNENLKDPKNKNWQPFGPISGPDTIGYYTQTMVLYEKDKEDSDVL